MEKIKEQMGEVEDCKESAPTVECCLDHVIDLISSLISQSYSIKAFHVKWQSIRSRLEELNSGLIAAKNYEISSFSELVPPVLVTVNDSNELARQCIDASYGGKLRMQSDLDVLSAKFEILLKKLAETCNIGNVTNGSAIVVPKPTKGASGGEMKFYVRDLVTRLKIGGLEMKIQALVALNEVVAEDVKCAGILVEIGEIITLLVSFIDFEEKKIQEESMKIILVIAGVDCYKGVLVGAGIIAPLLRAVELGSDSLKEQATRMLKKLTENSDNAWLVSAQGGVTALLKICTNGDEESELIVLACGVLKNLAGVEEIKRFMVEEGAVLAFINLLSSKDEVLQTNVIEFLQAIAAGDENIHWMIIKHGVIEPLIYAIDPKSSSSSKARRTALEAIKSFGFFNKKYVIILTSLQFLDHLLSLLRDADVSLQELAVKSTFCLCNMSEEINKAMGDAGFMSQLLILLDAKPFQVREMAAEALSSMLGVPKNRRRFLQDDSNVDRVMQLIEPDEGESGNKRLLLPSLISLTRCKSGRRKIANSSNLKTLQKLAEVEVVDAKKIIRKLSSQKFGSMFQGICYA